MQRMVLALSLALISGTAMAQPKAAAPADAKPPTVDAKSGAIMVTESDLKWVADPKRPGTYMAYGEGDPAKGAAMFYQKYDKGFAGGMHYHSSDHGGWILAGTLILEIDGKETKLPAGSFYFIKAKKPHVAKCDAGADCIMTVSTRGKWDAVAAKK